MPRLAAPLLLLVLAACSDAPAEMPPHDEAADALLAHVTGDAWDDIWETDAALGGSYRQSDGAVIDGLPPNPLPAFLSDEPPYLDAAAREQYTTRILGDTTVAGRAAQLVEARFVADERRTQPIRRVRAAVSDTALVWVEVQRAMDTILFDETSRLRAGLADAGGTLVPGLAEVQTTTDVPASDPRPLATGWERER
jgi:hypothetical protein